jgi:hypothetical protein
VSLRSALAATTVLGCDDHVEPEPDATETVYQEESTWSWQTNYTLLESDAGVFMVLNDRLLLLGRQNVLRGLQEKLTTKHDPHA